MKVLIKNLAEMEKFARQFIDELKVGARPKVICLSGELGSGKTAFVKAVAKIFGIDEDITSPTFVIQKNYILPTGKNFEKLIHIDAYRLDSGEELAKLGVDKIFADPKNLIFLEWPENVSEIMPKDSIYLKFQFIDDNTREITS